jgi:sugar lactone lactonase YvrE
MPSAPEPPTPLAGLRCQLGEGPVWNQASETLTWVDIAAGVLHCWRPGGEPSERLRVDGELSAALPRRGGGQILAVDRQLRAREPDGSETVVAEVESGLPDNRFNDCRCDPQGRLWAGTMSKRRLPGTASLYRVTPEAGAERMLAETTISNGLGWSGSGDRMFFIDSTSQRVDVFDFDQADGNAWNRRPFAAIDPADGLPDGLAIDAEDGVWVALFGGGAIHRYDADGRLDEVIELPVSNPTCPAFGGEGLETLFLTTARHRLNPEQLREQPLAGAVFAVQPGIRGRPTPACGL